MKELHKMLRKLPHVEKVELLSTAGLPQTKVKLRNGTNEEEIKAAATAHGFTVSNVRSAGGPLIYINDGRHSTFHVLIKRSDLSTGNFGLQTEKNIANELRQRVAKFFDRIGKLN